ncbi:MAG TPA: hypothetical protein VKE94_17615 [Gemmataceae bacterium]|nr:hypothetical protein [Gemmataceae bacterium]
MLRPFLALAFQTPARQLAFRRTVVAHVALLAVLLVTQGAGQSGSPSVALGLALLVAGIVEGAVLIGWRLTQLPKSQALEFLLVTPLRPRRLFLAEGLVGLLRLALVTLAGLPILVLLATDGRLDPLDVAVLLVVPFTWGAITGLGLTVWAYEPIVVRRWGERIVLSLLVVSLTVGALAGENLRRWIGALPDQSAQFVLLGMEAFHRFNPFAVVTHWFKEDAIVALDRMIGVELAAIGTVMFFAIRGAFRLQGHFHELHYQPVFLRSDRGRGKPGDRPLAWWAVRRVSRYSGRINLWLAGGFGVLYALYTVAGDDWPAWLGRRVFLVCDNVGGLPSLATALVVLAAVPAAFQYGLWDANAHERCRRLELLLLTRLDGRDYWGAAAAAAWKRGRGYFFVAVLLWAAACWGGQLTVLQALAAAATGVLLWGLYFSIGFRAFARGFQANGSGMALTVGLPFVAFLAYQAGWPGVATLTPPGGVQSASRGTASLAGLCGALLAGATALIVARRALRHCERDLRAWYERHHGRKVMT